jgi:hypothetical protein
MGVSKRVALSSHMGQRYYKLCQMTRDQWHLTILTYIKLNSMTWFGVILICKYTFQIQKVSHMTVIANRAWSVRVDRLLWIKHWTLSIYALRQTTRPNRRLTAYTLEVENCLFIYMFQILVSVIFNGEGLTTKSHVIYLRGNLEIVTQHHIGYIKHCIFSQQSLCVCVTLMDRFYA